MRWTIAAVFGLLVVFRVAGAADAPLPNLERGVVAWNEINLAARAAIREEQFAERWIRRAELSRTEAFAAYALEEARRASARSLTAKESAERRGWARIGELYSAHHSFAVASAESASPDVEVYAAPTEIAAEEAKALQDFRNQHFSRASDELSAQLAVLRAEYLAGR